MYICWNLCAEKKSLNLTNVLGLRKKCKGIIDCVKITEIMFSMYVKEYKTCTQSFILLCSLIPESSIPEL
jgi:hypothetical protein